MIVLGHWVKKKTPKASGNNGRENIEKTYTETKERAKQRQQNPEIQVVPQTSCLLSLSLSGAQGGPVI